MSRRKTTEEFIKQARDVHGYKYDYSKTEYINANTNVTITCLEHGDFNQVPYSHLKRCGCPKCVGRNKTTEEIVKEFKTVHGDKYDYSKVKYVKHNVNVIITCLIHGDFTQRVSKHLRGNGCPECGNVKISNSKIEQGRRVRDWNFKQPEEYKLIPLTRGKYAKVDNEDFERCKDINWLFNGRYARNDEFGAMHRYIMNAPDHLEVDHKEHNKLDNRKSNLRLATRSLNSANTRARGGSSVYKGVSWNKRMSNWQSQLGFKRVTYRLGYFTDEKEAGMAYDKKALELFGEFAYLNFPELKEQYLKELTITKLK